MSQERMAEVVQPLLKQLAEATARYKDYYPPTTKELLSKIEGEVEFIKDVFLRLERWERHIKDEIGVVARHLDDMLDCHNQAPGFQNNLITVNQKVSALKEHMTPPLKLPPAIFETATSPNPTTSSSSSAIEKRRLQLIKRNILIDLRTSHTILAASLRSETDLKDKFKKLQCVQPLLMFLDGAVINKRQLTYWWLAEDLISSLELEAEAWINKLVDRSHIAPIYRCHNLTVASFMIQSSIIDDSSRDRMRAIASFRGCLNVNQHYLKFDRKNFMEMRNTTVLQLGRWQGSAKQRTPNS